MTYYNTTNLKGTQLDLAVQSCKSEKEGILWIYRTTKVRLSASQVKRLYDISCKEILLTNARRAINTLCKESQIEKTPYKVMGLYGRNEYQWRVVN